MRILRIVALVMGALWFFPVSCSTGLIAGTWAISHLDARDIAKGREPHQPFFVTAQPGEGNRPFSVVSLKDLEKFKRDFPGTSFVMSSPAGRLELGGRTKCSYRVVSESGTRQTIEVVWSDDDKTIRSRYRASRSDVVPVYSRMYYHGYMFQALPLALVFALVVLTAGRLLRRKLSGMAGEGSSPQSRSSRGRRNDA
ncbi:MAG: hypothetical protein V1792_08980 [Pseudomonadota bacterium]